MAGGKDKRGQGEKARRRWKDEWMVVTDRQGDRVGDWAKHADLKRFRCQWCNTVSFIFLKIFIINNFGREILMLKVMLIN